MLPVVVGRARRPHIIQHLSSIGLAPLVMTESRKGGTGTMSMRFEISLVMQIFTPPCINDDVEGLA